MGESYAILLEQGQQIDLQVRSSLFTCLCRIFKLKSDWVIEKIQKFTIQKKNM